jgi:hypothetical protein
MSHPLDICDILFQTGDSNSNREDPMGVELNEKIVNDTAKLVMHRLVARQLSRDPLALLLATTYLKRVAERYPGRSFVDEWQLILRLPIKDIQAKQINRDEEMTRLRSSSPFVLVKVGVDLRNVAVRRRIWKLARRLAMRSSERTGPLPCDTGNGGLDHEHVAVRTLLDLERVCRAKGSYVKTDAVLLVATGEG